MPKQNKLPPGNELKSTSVRKSRIRRYQYKLDIRSIMDRWNSMAERSGTAAIQTRDALVRTLKQHPVFAKHHSLDLLRRATTEDSLEAALDEIWKQAEERNLVLLA